MSALEKPLWGLPRRFYLISLAGFLNNMGGATAQPIQTLHYIGAGASLLQIGTVVSVQALLLIFLRLPMTLLAHRLGEKRMLGLAFLLQILSLTFISRITDPSLLLYVPLVNVVPVALFWPLSLSINSNMADRGRQGAAVGRHMTVMSSSMFLGPAVTSQLVRFLPYGGVILTAAVFPLLGFLVFLYATRGYRDVGSDVSAGGFPSLASLRALLGQRNITLLSFVRVLYATSNNTFTTLFSVYAKQGLGLDASVISLLYSVMGLANFSLKVPSGWVSDRMGRRFVLFATFGLVIATFLGFAYLTSVPALGVLLFLFGGCWGIRAVTEWAFLATLVPPEMKTVSVGYMESFWDMGVAGGGYLAGSLGGNLPYTTIFLLLAAINLPAVAGVHFMKEKRG